jgi:hypothetical protein
VRKHIRHDADPLVEYTGYLDDVRGGWVMDMQFTLEDFKAHIAGLSKSG